MNSYSQLVDNHAALRMVFPAHSRQFDPVTPPQFVFSDDGTQSESPRAGEIGRPRPGQMLFNRSATDGE